MKTEDVMDYIEREKLAAENEALREVLRALVGAFGLQPFIENGEEHWQCPYCLSRARYKYGVEHERWCAWDAARKFVGE